MESGSRTETADGPPTDVKYVRRRLEAIYHDINNPISIVAGNAELLMELAQSRGLGSDLLEPLSDIEKATRQISEHVERLARLKSILDDLAGDT